MIHYLYFISLISYNGLWDYICTAKYKKAMPTYKHMHKKIIHSLFTQQKQFLKLHHSVLDFVASFSSLHFLTMRSKVQR